MFHSAYAPIQFHQIMTNLSLFAFWIFTSALICALLDWETFRKILGLDKDDDDDNNGDGGIMQPVVVYHD